jgi:hypothetical protein
MKKIISKPVTFVVLALSVCFFGSAAQAVAAVHARFDLGTPATGPFPSDWFTVADRSQYTRRRVNLPLPDCAVRQSDCQDLNVINTLDGFNVQPRLSIPFDRPIDVTTVTSQTVFLISLGSTLRGRDDDDCGEDGRDSSGCDEGGRVIGINQVVWDTFTNTLHVESDELLDQHTRYALIVTRAIQDADGQSVEASEAFRRFRQTVLGEYRHALLEAVHAAWRIGVRENEIVTASVFTTQTVTSILEKIRDQIKAGTPEPADFLLGPGGTRTVFSLDGVGSITFRQQTRDDPPGFDDVQVPVDLLRIIPGAVGTVAFGKYNSPDYEVHPGEFIPPVGTRTGIPAVQETNEIYFNLFVPSGPKPADGWPVAIFGHGVGQDKNQSFNAAATMAAHGIATIAINVVGHGFGPLGTLRVDLTNGESITFSAGGRSLDQNHDNEIGRDEGFTAAPPQTIVYVADGVRQTVADLMQLVEAIKVGMDVDGDGVPDLDPSRIFCVGNSLGGNFGTVFLGVEPSVHAGVFSSSGNPVSENRRLSPGGRPQLGQLLQWRTPPLINEPGIAGLDGVSVTPPRFNENLPLRNGLPLSVLLADGTSYDIQSPVTNTVAGAMLIEEVAENLVWVSQPGSAVAYSPYLRKSPLAGMPEKSVVYQFAKGDQGAPNPNMSAILRAGDLSDRATFYRHDLASAENPMLPRNPHGFMVRIEIPAFRPIARGAQEQIAVFFETDGAVIIHPDPARFFEVPIEGPLPEGLNYIP